MWPKFDEQALVRERVEIAVQVNGTIKFRMESPRLMTANRLKKLSWADPRTEPALESRTVRRVIVVPGRLVNLVV
jgi:leucyl-tRNA synthetase